MNKKTLISAVVCIVILLPIAYLVVKKKTPATADKVQQPVANQPKIDIAALEALVKSKPDYENLINLSQGYINSNMPGKSITYLKQAIKLDSTKAAAYNNLGVANIMLKNYKQGIAACVKAVSLDGKSELAKNNLKWGIDESNKTIDMIAQLEKTPADKKNTDYYIRLGLYNLYIGNYDKSIATWQEGLSKDVNNNIFINDIGTALVLKKEYDKAIAEFNKVLKADPNNQLAKNNIEWALSEKKGE